jgi:thiamine transporter
MPDRFFGMTMTSPWIYSAIYNGFYTVTSLALVVIVGLLLWKPMGKYLQGLDLR